MSLLCLGMGKVNTEKRPDNPKQLKRKDEKRKPRKTQNNLWEQD